MSFHQWRIGKKYWHENEKRANFIGTPSFKRSDKSLYVDANFGREAFNVWRKTTDNYLSWRLNIACRYSFIDKKLFEHFFYILAHLLMLLFGGSDDPEKIKHGCANVNRCESLNDFLFWRLITWICKMRCNLKDVNCEFKSFTVKLYFWLSLFSFYKVVAQQKILRT